jgi:WD40 repeat protein
LLAPTLAARQPGKEPPQFPPINPAAARPDRTFPGLPGPGLALAWRPGLNGLAAGGEEGAVALWPADVVRDGGPASPVPKLFPGHKGPVLALAAGENLLASGGADKRILLWDPAQEKALHTLTAEHVVRALALAPDGKLLAAASAGNAIQTWDAVTGQPGEPLKDHTDWVLALAFSPDGNRLASGGHDGVVRLWEMPARTKVRELRGPLPKDAKRDPPRETVQALAFSPDGKTLAAGTWNAEIHLFSADDGKLLRTLKGHTGTVTALAFHPAGAALASAGRDGTVKLWNPANGQLVKSLDGHTAWVQGVVFLDRGARLASVGADRTVRLWKLTGK